MSFYKYLVPIDNTAPEGVRMFYRLVENANCSGYLEGKTNPRRVLFSSVAAFEKFKTDFPEMVPYLRDGPASKVVTTVTPIEPFSVDGPLLTGDRALKAARAMGKPLSVAQVLLNTYEVLLVLQKAAIAMGVPLSEVTQGFDGWCSRTPLSSIEAAQVVYRRAASGLSLPWEEKEE